MAREAAALLGAGAAGIIRFDGENEATVMGSWADHEGGRYLPGTVIEIKPGSDVARAEKPACRYGSMGIPPTAR